jgi:hypothetical protein
MRLFIMNFAQKESVKSLLPIISSLRFCISSFTDISLNLFLSGTCSYKNFEISFSVTMQIIFSFLDMLTLLILYQYNVSNIKEPFSIIN